MKKVIKRSIVKLVKQFGYSIQPTVEKYQNIAVELDDNDVDLLKYVLDSGYTMTSVQRLVGTLKSCRYVVENKIPGDFVECGVWRGGNGILAKCLFEQLDSKRRVWMFDTFEGKNFELVISKKGGYPNYDSCKFHGNKSAMEIEGTAVTDLPASATRDRALYVGELSSRVVVTDDSKGIVQIYFDYSNGLAFDDDCDAVKFNSGDFDMSVITE